VGEHYAIDILKMIRYLLDNFISPLILALLTSIILGIASKITTGNWMEWFNLIPKFIWIISILIILFWIILIYVFKRVKHLKELDSSYAIGIPSATLGWITHGNLEYAGVIWRVQAPKEYPWSYNSSRIEVKTPPRCPNCETELDESHSFWSGHIWRCFGCDFKKRSKYSFYDEKKRAAKIARRQCERLNEKNYEI